MSKYYYLDIQLVFADSIDYGITAEYFKNNIVKSINKLFGESASCIDIDLIKYDSKIRRGIIRVPTEYYVKVRSSLTLCGDYSGDSCAIRVYKASPLLLALQGDSRSFTH